MQDLVSVIQSLYASEINAGLQSDWDAGFAVWLGYSGRRVTETFTVEQFADGREVAGRNGAAPLP